MFIAALAWCPFWLGGNTLLGWGIDAMLFPGLAVIYEISRLAGGVSHPVGLRRIAMPAALFATVVVWIMVQNSVLAPAGLSHPVWGMAAEALDRPVAGSISVNRDLTTLALIRLLTDASAFWIALQLCRDGARSNTLIGAVAIICVVYAAYGLIAFALTPGHVLWLDNPYMRGFVTSTFYNRNSFATFGGIGLVAMCGIILRVYRHSVISEGGSRGFRVASIIEATGQAGAVLLAGAFIILVAILLTGSRGGIISTAFGLFVLAILMIGRRRRGSAEQRDMIVLVGLAVAAGFAAFGDTFVGKVSEQGLYDGARMAIYAITFGSILDSPLLGYGYGTFADVFPMFRDRSVAVDGVWEMAHNTYLEVFQGLGLVFGAMLVGCLGLLILRCLKGATTRQANATVPSVAASIGFLVAVNALVDFSLQIEAVALTFMALLGAGVAQSDSSRLALDD